MELWRWVRSAQGAAWMSKMTEAMKETLWGIENPEYASTLILEEGANELLADTLLRASPFFVSREMCEIAQQALATFRSEPIHHADLLADEGFMFFEKPLFLGTEGPAGDEDARWYVKASAWTLVRDAYRQPNGLAIFPFELRDPLPNAPAATPSPGASIPFDTDRPYSDGVFYWHLAPMHVAMKLASEWKPASRYSAHPDRAARRQAKKLEFPERETIVVHLRRVRPVHEGEPSSSVEWSHRWMVSGHWRNQWFPTQKRHKQIWIHPYVKGPEDKPLAPAKPRVFTWTR